MQIFEDPITRWRHSKTCLQSSSGKVRKDKDGSTMQVFLTANNLSELRREQNKSRAISRSVGPGQSPGTDLRCFICKTTFVSIDEMRAHVRTPCRKRTTLAVPKHKFSALPAEVKTSIQIPNTASEIIYIKDGHQTVISLENAYTEEVLNTEFTEPSQEFETDNISATEEVVILPDTFDTTTNLNAIEQTVEISAIETVFPVVSKSEEVIKQPKNWNENKENNVRKRKRILFPKEVDDWQNRKTSNSPKSDLQVTLSSSPLKSDDPKDVLNDFETPPMKISKIINKDPEDETTQVKFRAKPLQTKEEFSQLLTAEKKDNQVFLEEEPLSNGVVTELVTDEVVLFEDPDSPAEKIVTGAAAEARLKDLFSTIDIQNKAKLSSPTKQAKTINSSPKSPCKTSSSPNIRKDEINNYRNNDVEKDEKQLSLSKEEEVDTSGFLLYMPPINAGSVTLPDPLLDLRSGLPAEMLLDETTNTKPPIPNVPEAINHFDASDIMEETRLPSHIFDGDLLPSHNHSEVLFEEIMDEKENSPLDESKLAEGLVSDEINFEEAVNIESPVGVNEVEEEREKMIPAREVLSVEEVDAPSPRHSEENQEILEESKLDQINNEESLLPVAKSLEMSNQVVELIPEEKNSEMKSDKETDKEEEDISVTEKIETKPKHKSAKLFKCKACNNMFKTSQALQKHSRVPCKVKHTRSLSQKILRPKQPCIKIEKKPIKKKMVKPQRRPKFMVPIIPITRSELIRPTVPRRPKRFSRRKRKKSFFIDEQNRILPFVNVLMSELSDKDRFFYKLGMINQCRKIPASSETTTVPNGEIAAVETLGDSLEQCLSKIDAKTDPTYLSEIASLSPAKVVAAEPQGIAFSASPAVAAACVSDKENPSALAKGLCLSLPTLEKMEDDQFHDPNCISPIHVKAEPHDPTGQSVQSPCWEAAPCLAQLPGVMQIVRVTSAKSLNEIDTTDKPSVTPESDQSNILVNGKNLSSSNSSPQSKKMSKETVNDSNSNIGCQLGAKTLALKCEKKKVMNLKEAFENVVEDSASLPKKVSATLPEKSIKEQSCSDAVQKDKTNLSEKNIECKSDNKLKIQTKTKAESKKQLKKSKMVSLDNTDQCHRHKNSAKSKHNHSCTTKHDVIKPVNQSKIHSRNNNINRNAKATDSCNGANIEKGKKMPHSVVGSDSSNSQKRISSTLSKNVKTLSSKKVTPDRKVSCKRATSKQETPLATTSLCKKVASKQETPLATTSLCKKVASKQETPLATTSLCKKVASKQETPLATTSLCKKVASKQETPLATTSLCKKVASKQETPLATTSLCKKVASKQENPLATTSLCKKVASKQETPLATTSLCKKVASKQETPLATLPKKVASNQEVPVATSVSCKKVASSKESLMATSTLRMKQNSSQEPFIATTNLNKKIASSPESPVATTSLCEKLTSCGNPALSTFSLSSKKIPSKLHSMALNMELLSTLSSPMKESRNLVSPKTENFSESLLSNDRTFPTQSTMSPLSKTVYGSGSESVSNQTTHYTLSRCQRKTCTLQMPENQIQKLL